MGMTLPSELGSLLNLLGYKWPEGDEQKIFEMGQRWSDFGGTLNEVAQAGDQAASVVWSGNTGANIDAFASHWKDNDGPARILRDGGTAASLVGTGMTICAGIMLVLKVNVIVQLTTLAIQIMQAMAAAVATFGASLSEIPIFQQITREIVSELIQQVISRLANA